MKKTGNLGKLTQNTGKRYNMCVTVMRKKIGDQNCDKNVLSYHILSSLVCHHFFPLFFPMYWSSVFAKRLVTNLGDPASQNQRKGCFPTTTRLSCRFYTTILTVKPLGDMTSHCLNNDDQASREISVWVMQNERIKKWKEHSLHVAPLKHYHIAPFFFPNLTFFSQRFVYNLI